MQTAIGRKVADDRDAALGTVPKRVEDSNVLLTGAVALPVADPSFEDFSDLAIADGHFFDAVDFETGSVEHLLYRSRCRLENRQCHHLVQPDGLGYVASVS